MAWAPLLLLYCMVCLDVYLVRLVCVLPSGW